MNSRLPLFAASAGIGTRTVARHIDLTTGSTPDCLPVQGMFAVAMETPPDHLLRVRRRVDLVAQPQRIGSGTVWAVKDPLSRRYFHLTEESWWILSRLDGTLDVETLRLEFQRRFPPQSLSRHELEASLAQFHRQGLIVSRADDQDQELLAASGRERRAEFWRTVLNPMAIRLRGIDPDQALRALQPVTRWLWHPATLAVGCVWVFVTLGFALLHADTIVRRAGETEPYLSGAGMLLLPLSLGMTKVLHELGHGLACKRLGAECHELGILFLVFTPCLYCDVSDAWMLPGKWQRIAVSVAGVWVDLLLATLAGWLWWFSQPGLFQALCGSVVVVCSFATIAFNANPLMRYDGYYALADLLEIPNLAQRANDTLTHWCRLVWGDDSRLAFRSRPMEQVGLVAYACGSWMWRMLLIGSILWLVATTLAPHHLDSLTGVLALLMLTGMVADPARQLAQRIKTPTRVPPEIRRRRVLLVATALALITAVLFIPWPHSERTPAMIEPAGADAVYVSFPGTLLRACAPGTEVSAGDEIAVLQNRELSLEIDRLQSERERSRLRLENLRRRQGGDPLAAAEIPTTEESLAAVEARLERKLEDARRLVLRAPRNGVVLPPAEKQIPVDDDRLAGWSGTPLDSRNVGCHLEMGTLICEVGNPQSREARLLVDQNQIEFIARGDTVEVLLDQCPWSPLHGTIHDVSQVELTAIPPALARHADLPVRVDERGVTRPAGTVYQARVTLDPAPVQTLLRQTGRARIQTRRISLWRRGMRALGETLGIVLELKSLR